MTLEELFSHIPKIVPYKCTALLEALRGEDIETLEDFVQCDIEDLKNVFERAQCKLSIGISSALRKEIRKALGL